MSTFLREVRLPEATRDIVMAWLSSAFGCEPNEVSALNALSLAAVHGQDARQMVGFGSDPEALDAKSVSEVQDAFAAFLPDARVLKVDAHDWNADPYSLGSWMAFRPSQITRLGAGLRRRRGGWPSRRPIRRSDGRGTSTGDRERKPRCQAYNRATRCTR